MYKWLEEISVKRQEKLIIFLLSEKDFFVIGPVVDMVELSRFKNGIEIYGFFFHKTVENKNW